MSFAAVRANLAQANEAQAVLSRAIMDFQAACMIADFDQAERMRIDCQEALNVVLDNIATMHKELQRTVGGHRA